MKLDAAFGRQQELRAMEQMGIDGSKRRHSRRPVQLSARLSFAGRQIEAQTENISPGGALLNVALPLGTQLVAKLALRTGREVRIRARVCWRRLSPPGVGIEFSGFYGPYEDPDETEH
jgi:PilZ domain